MDDIIAKKRAWVDILREEGRLAFGQGGVSAFFFPVSILYVTIASNKIRWKFCSYSFDSEKKRGPRAYTHKKKKRISPGKSIQRRDSTRAVPPMFDPVKLSSS